MNSPGPSSPPSPPTPTSHRVEEPPERAKHLWLLIVPPTIWAAHFLACYITAAIWCAKAASRDASLHPVRWAIGAYTLVALAGIALGGFGGLRRHRFGAGRLPHDSDTPGDRHRFLGFATLLLAGLSAVAVLFAAAVVLYFHDCR